MKFLEETTKFPIFKSFWQICILINKKKFSLLSIKTRGEKSRAIVPLRVVLGLSASLVTSCILFEQEVAVTAATRPNNDSLKCLRPQAHIVQVLLY